MKGTAGKLKKAFAAVFSSAAGHGVNQRRVRMAAASLLVVFSLAAVVLNRQIGFAVVINGESVGTADSKAQAEALIENAEKQAEEILGHELSIAEEVVVAAEIAPEKSAAGQLEDSILCSIEGIVRRWAITVDGTIVGSSENEEELTAVLDSILAEYRTPETTALTFCEDVRVESLLLREDTTQDIAEIAAMLNMNPATVRSVKSRSLARLRTMLSEE